MNYIDTSIFELFEIGPGPSSSHTIGPMKAANNFINCLKELPAHLKKEITKIEVYLYGSLSTTGMGHGTHKAILAGLLGYLPYNIDTKFFRTLFNNLTENYLLTIDNITINFSFNNIHFKHSQYNSPYQNTLLFKSYTNKIIPGS